MPRVPLYEGPQVQQNVQAAPQQNFQQQQDVSAQGRQLASALNQSGEQLDKFNLRNAQDAAFQAETEIKAAWLQTDADLRKRYRGSNVDGYQEEVAKFWSETSAKYGEKLDPLARQVATKSLANAQAMAQAGAVRYYESEKESGTIQAWEAAKTITKQMALTDGSEPAIGAARVDIARKNSMEAARRGLTSEELQALNLRDLTSLHSEFISTTAQANPEQAKAYFDKFKDEIDASRHDTINKVLDNEIRNTTAKKTADSWANLPMAEQLTKLAEIKDPQLREKTQLFVKQNHALVKEAQQENEKKYSDQAWQLVGAGKRVPEAVLSQMDGKERVQLQDYLVRRAEHNATVGAAKPPKTDPKLHAELWDEMVRDPEAFKARRLAPLAMRLSPQDLEQLAMQQKGLMNPKKEADIVKYQGKVTAMADMLGIKKNDLEKRGMFVRAAQMEFEAYQTRTGKPPTPEEEDKMIDRLALPGASHWFSPSSPSKTYAESVVTGKAFIPDIPSADRNTIVEKMKTRGISKPTDEQIDKAYRAWKGIK